MAEKNVLSIQRKSYTTFAILAVAVIAILVSLVSARYVTNVTEKGEVTAELFYTDGDYVEKIEGENDNGPVIKVSGWKNGIYLNLYNYENDDVSQVDITYSCKLTDGWTVTATDEKLNAGEEDSVELTLIPSDTAKIGDIVEFSLTTEPYAVTMKARFLLTDSREPDWKIEDMGPYTLLTIYSNDYEGEMNITYDEAIFAPDTTNNLMGTWNRESGSGSFTAKSFTTYELMLFEEIPDTYTFTPDKGTGKTISISTQ